MFIAIVVVVVITLYAACAAAKRADKAYGYDEAEELPHRPRRSGL